MSYEPNRYIIMMDESFAWLQTCLRQVSFADEALFLLLHLDISLPKSAFRRSAGVGHIVSFAAYRETG